MYWRFSLGAILAKYLDVCETTATTTHILRATSTLLINIVLNWGQSVGGLHRQGVYYAVCREQERELVAVTTTEQEKPQGHLGNAVGSGAMNVNLFSLSTPALLSIKRLHCVYVGRGHLHGTRIPDASACFGNYLSELLHL